MEKIRFTNDVLRITIPQSTALSPGIGSAEFYSAFLFLYWKAEDSWSRRIKVSLFNAARRLCIGLAWILCD